MRKRKGTPATAASCVCAPVVEHSRAAMRVTVDLYAQRSAYVRVDDTTLRMKRGRRVKVSNAERGGEVGGRRGSCGEG
jgi:hypothetical protein